LRAAFGAEVVEQSKFIDADELLDCYELCQQGSHFGCVHWADADLVATLKEHRIKPTPETIDDIKSTCRIRHIAHRMIETGWEVIEQAILDAGAKAPR
jgi:hypothetical protein